MRKFIVIGVLLALAGCNGYDPSKPAKVSWDYTTGTGDGVPYSGPKPIYKRAYGLDADQVGTSTEKPRVNYSWGADNQDGGMVQVDPSTTQRVAAPTPTPNPAPTPAERAATPGTHS